jgi:peptide/nickel transport system substrate-binding protein
VRNPYFRQWSYAAQPAGYPGVIRFEQMTDPGKQQAAVIAGRADLVDIVQNGQPYHPLAVRYPTRLHPGIKAETGFVFLNTRQPPFTNIKARQAVNYAIDRARIIQLLGLGPAEATPTCQILPADFPGHKPYCPYTTGSQNGSWHGPDIGKARRLAKESGTTNVPVTMWTFNDRADEAVGSYLVQLLKDLGYQAHLHAVSGDRFWAGTSNSRNGVQVGGIVGWAADFPAASDFILPTLTCRSFTLTPPIARRRKWRPSGRQAGQQGRQRSLPTRLARRLWAQVDRIVTDQAPWVPVDNSSTSAGFVSARVGNYQDSPFYGPLVDQMWVR